MMIEEQDRFLRHESIEWFSQREVRESAIAVIGAGAIGNEVVKNLCLLGVGTIDVFDFDQIAIHNLTRSIFFREQDIGSNKAECLSKRASEIDPEIKITAFKGDFWDHLSISDIKQYSAVISCVDNFEARIGLNRLCFIAGVNFVNTGIDSRLALIENYPFSSGISVPCLECNLPSSVYKRIASRYSCGWIRKKALEVNAVPTTIITSSIAGAFAASWALYSSGLSDNSLEPFRVLIDAKSGNMSSSRITKNHSCFRCGSYKSRPTIINVDSTTSILGEHPSIDNLYTSSDQIITSYRCKNECKVDVNPYVMHKARNFDSSIYKCPVCGNESIDIKIRDEFTGREILELCKDEKFPAKYLLTTIDGESICFNLEG